MNTKTLIDVNRKAWNYATKLHQIVQKEKLDIKFADQSYVCFDSESLVEIERLNINNKDIVHLCCNNGKEIISLSRLGANRCVGFDFCDEAIIEASNRALSIKSDVEFVRCNVLEIDEKYFNSFDIVYMSVGTLRWIPDLGKLFKIISSLLRTGGIVYIKEMHPFTEIINDDRQPDKNPLLIVNSYFNEAPFSDKNSLDYIGHTNEKGLEKFWHIHTFTDILSSVINSGFSLERFEEYTTDISDVYPTLASSELQLPLSFMILARK